MKRRISVAVCAVLFFAICVFALMYGSYTMSPAEVFDTLLHGGDNSQHLAIWGIRLPRMLVAVFVGAALAVSGCIIQGVTRNPLAEPGIIGINSGATLAVVLFISFRSAEYYSALQMSTVILIPVIAALGAFIAAGLIWLLSLKRGRAGSNRLVLVGVGVNVAVSAIVTLIQLNMNRGSYNQALSWTNGSLWGTGFEYLAMIGPLTVVIFGVLMYRGLTLDVMNLGDEIATGLGIDVERERRRLLILAVLLAAGATAVAGNISFVGLLGPHLAQNLVGPVHRRKLPMAAVISGALVVLADTLSRNLFSPLEIPVGITLSLIGVPYFIYLMLKEK
ncbi:MAG: iron ABC transporter permease [Clostridia bacterium]|nr:iron ABC transporter permease [Clostridia bacterium]